MAKREQLEAALEFCRDGDVLIVTKLDRLARCGPFRTGLQTRMG